MTLIVRVSAGGMRVEGFARKNGKGWRERWCCWFPGMRAAFPSWCGGTSRTRMEAFRSADAAPGQYTVVAIEDGWGMDWTRPEVIGRYLPGGIAVTVQDTLDRYVRLPGGSSSRALTGSG